MTPWNLARIVTAALAPLFTFLPAQAGAFQVYAPEVEAGEAEIAIHNDGQNDGSNRQQLELGYGVTPRWFTGLYGVWRQAPHQTRRVEAVKWENVLLPSDSEHRALPWGLYLEVEQPVRAGATEVEIKGLFQKRLGAWEHLANLGVGKALEDTADADPTVGYAWRSAWASGHMQWAIEGYGRLGRLHGPSWQGGGQHRWGPVLRLHVGELKIDAGYLLGLRDPTLDTWKLNLEWSLD